VVPALSILILTTAWGANPPAADEYVFIEDIDRWVNFTSGQHVFIGKLDSQGEFHEQNRYNRNDPLSIPGDILYMPRLKPYAAYEYRSGRLIKGVIDPEGYFVPDLDSTVTNFKDYTYSPQEPSIWNLPGRFEKKNPDKKQ
jgi:hypothetical protein